VSSLVQFEGHEEPSLVPWKRIRHFGNGESIKKGGELALSSWKTWKKSTKTSHLWPELKALDSYGELPCRDTHHHGKVSFSDNHDHDIWVFYGCRHPLHYRDMRLDRRYECTPGLEETLDIFEKWPELDWPIDVRAARKRLNQSSKD
jgi:hypothetical protein